MSIGSFIRSFKKAVAELRRANDNINDFTSKPARGDDQIKWPRRH